MLLTFEKSLSLAGFLQGLPPEAIAKELLMLLTDTNKNYPLLYLPRDVAKLAKSERGKDFLDPDYRRDGWLVLRPGVMSFGCWWDEYPWLSSWRDEPELIQNGYVPFPVQILADKLSMLQQRLAIHEQIALAAKEAAL